MIKKIIYRIGFEVYITYILYYFTFSISSAVTIIFDNILFRQMSLHSLAEKTSDVRFLCQVNQRFALEIILYEWHFVLYRFLLFE